MKTLDQINDDIRTEVNRRMEKCKEVLDSCHDPVFSKTMQNAFVDVEVNNTFLALYDIVEKLDKYLKMPSLDGRMERQTIRKELQEMIDAI